MDIILPKNLEDLKRHLHDPLYRNSFYILLTLITGAVFGFVFWIVAAKIYPPEIVGINTALISAVSLIAIISFLGLDQSIIRFFPDGDKFKILVTSSTIITFASIFFGIIFVLGIDIWSPNLALIKNNLMAFFISLVAFSLITPLSNAFISLRKGEYYFYQNLIMGLRVLILFMPIFGTLGIFLSFALSSILAILFSFFIFYRYGKRNIDLKCNFKIDIDFLKDSFHFTAGNYLSGLFALSPTYLLPIMVLNILGGEFTANYYISYTIASLLFMIPSAFSTSLFVEGSHGESLRLIVLKSLLAIFSILIPLAIILFIFGGDILGLIGNDYIQGLGLLKALIISSFFVSICHVYFSIGKIQKTMKSLILMNFLIFTLLIGLSYPLMIKYGITGVGYAWIISYFVGSIIVGILIRKQI